MIEKRGEAAPPPEILLGTDRVEAAFISRWKRTVLLRGNRAACAAA